MYPRNHEQVGSSSFEHIFMSEMKFGQPIGMHNWIYYYYLEGKNDKVHTVDYKGFLNDLRLGNVNDFLIIFFFI